MKRIFSDDDCNGNDCYCISLCQSDGNVEDWRSEMKEHPDEASIA